MSNRPDFRLTMDGDDMRGGVFAAFGTPRDLTAKVRPRLVSLSLTEKRGGEADQLDIVLDDSDGQLALPRKGAVISLLLGWASGPDVNAGLVDKGRFKVDDVEWGGPPDQVTIKARSADLTADFRVRKEGAWRDTTLGAVAREVAGRNKLEAKVAPDLADVPVQVLAQHHQSDMALLRRLGREHDAVATVKAGKLILSPIGKGETTSGAPIPVVRLTRADVAPGYRYREVDRSAEAGVEARWHDADAGERKTVTVKPEQDDPDLGTGEGDRDDPDLGTGEGDGEDPGRGEDPGIGTGEGEDGAARPRRLGRVYHSEADARAAARAEASRATRSAAEFDCTLPLGRPDLYPETGVTLSGFKKQPDAHSWILAEVTHALDASGLTTRLKLETKG